MKYILAESRGEEIKAPIRAAGMSATACTGNERAIMRVVHASNARVSPLSQRDPRAELDRRKLLLNCELLAGRQGFEPR